MHGPVGLVVRHRQVGHRQPTEDEVAEAAEHASAVPQADSLGDPGRTSRPIAKNATSIGSCITANATAETAGSGPSAKPARRSAVSSGKGGLSATNSSASTGATNRDTTAASRRDGVSGNIGAPRVEWPGPATTPGHLSTGVRGIVRKPLVVSTFDDCPRRPWAHLPCSCADTSRTPRAVELAAAPLLGALGVAELLVPFGSRAGSGSEVGCAIAVVVVAVSTLWCRRQPLVPLVTFGAAWALAAMVSGSVFILFYGQLATVLVLLSWRCASGRDGSPRSAPAGGGFFLAIDILSSTMRSPGELFFHWTVGVFTAATAFGLRRLEQRAHDSMRRAVEAEVGAAETALRAVVEERTRIARELHDIVAHAVTSMVVQAGAAEQADGDRTFVDGALASIRRTGNEALSEMRRLVTMLRGEGEAPLGPQPRLDALPTLIDSASAHGPRTRLEVAGSARDLPPGLDLDRLPDRAGGAHQRPEARGRHGVRRPADLRTGGRCGWRSSTTGGEPQPGPGGSATVWSACGSGSACTAAGWRSARARTRVRGACGAPGGDMTGEAPLRILVVDDQELVRAGFRMILERGGLEVVGEASDGASAVALAKRLVPDVVLMDIRMPVLDGIEATRQVVAAQPEVRVVVLTTFDLDEYVLQAVRAGASGFLLKDIPPADLVHAVQVVARGDALLAPALTRRLLERFAASPGLTACPALERLTPREGEVVRLVASGLSNAEIGTALFLSEATVKTYVSRLLAKLAVRDRVQLTVLAYESGLVVPGGSAH